jgi:hypothetical protein
MVPDPRGTSRWSTGLRWAALVVVAAQVLWGAWWVGGESLARLRDVRHHRREDAAAARRRALGEAYGRGLEAVEAAIPPHGRYFVVDLDKAGTVWLLQGDLAPRRPQILREPAGLWRRWKRHRLAPDAPPWVVVYRSPDEAAEVLPTSAYAKSLQR